MAPRIQCLNVLRRIAKRRNVDGHLHAEFSTSVRALADINSPSSRSVNFDRNRPASSSTTTSPFRESPQTTNDSPLSSPTSVFQSLALASQTSSRSRNRSERPSNVKRQPLSEQLVQHKQAADLARQITRRWKTGDIYAPHDLSSVEMTKWKQRAKPTVDAFDVLCMDPLEQYKNYAMMAEYVTPMGRLKHSSETGLRAKNQRKISKAVRRLIGLGLMPAVYHHPEILQKKAKGAAGRGQVNASRGSFF